jgi:hypothetical protein
MENENIKEIDINPVIICGGKPVAVDALVVLVTEDRRKEEQKVRRSEDQRVRR